MLPAPRLPLVTSFDDELQAILDKIPNQNGTYANVFLTLAHHPRLLKRFNVFAGAFYISQVTSLRSREIVILRIAWRTGCEYEFSHHASLGERIGLSETEIAALASDKGPEDWDRTEAALVSMVDELFEDDRVGDDTWTELARTRSAPELLELMMIVGCYRMLSGILRSIGVELDGYVPELLPPNAAAR